MITKTDIREYCHEAKLVISEKLQIRWQLLRKDPWWRIGLDLLEWLIFNTILFPSYYRSHLKILFTRPKHFCREFIWEHWRRRINLEPQGRSLNGEDPHHTKCARCLDFGLTTMIPASAPYMRFHHYVEFRKSFDHSGLEEGSSRCRRLRVCADCRRRDGRAIWPEQRFLPLNRNHQIILYNGSCNRCRARYGNRPAGYELPANPDTSPPPIRGGIYIRRKSDDEK